MATKQKEVSSYGGSSSSPERRDARQPRIMDKREQTLNLVHNPTKLEVGGQIPPGNYSRKEMSRLHELLYNQLLIELENKVAHFLKIPRR